MFDRAKPLCLLTSSLSILPATILLLLVTAFSSSADEAPNAVLTPQIGHTSHIGAVAYSPDGKRIATGGSDNAVRLWDLETGRLIRSLPHEKTIKAIAFSPDGKQVAVSSERSWLRIWNPLTGQVIKTLKDADSSGQNAIVYSNDGTHLLGAAFNKLELIEVSSGKVVREFESDLKHITAATVSTDGSLIVAGYYGGDLALWNARSGKLLWSSRKVHKSGVRSVAFTKDGSQIVSTSYITSKRDDVKIWDARTGKLARIFKTKGDSGGVARFSPDGKKIAIGSHGGDLDIWDFESQTLLRSLPHEAVYAASFSPDGSRIVTGSVKRVTLWDVDTGEKIRSLKGQHSRDTPLQFSKNGKQLLAGPRAWDLVTGQLVHTSNIEFVWALSPDGAHAASRPSRASSEKYGIVIRDILSGKVTTRLKGQSGFPLAFSPDGGRITTSKYTFIPDPWKEESVLKLWDADSGDFIRELTKVSGEFRSVAFSPDGSKIVFGSGSKGQLSLIDAMSGREIWSGKADAKIVKAPAFSPDGKRLVTGGSWALEQWDTETGEKLFNFGGPSPWNGKWHDDAILALTYSPDGRFVASGSEDKTIRIWDARTGKLVRSLAGHAYDVNRLAFSPDGNRIASASPNGIVKIWNALDGTLMLTFVTEGDDWLAITPEGFFASSKDGVKNLVVVRGYETYAIDQFYQELYRPDLVREKLAGDPAGTVRKAAARVDLDKLLAKGSAPAIEFRSPDEGTSTKAEKITVRATVVGRGGGIGRIEWRVNGVTLGIQQRGFARVSDTGTSTAKVISRTLRLVPGKNEISLVAYNAANEIASPEAKLTVNRAVKRKSRRPHMHVLAVGIDDYFDSRLRLNYAVSDAKALGEALSIAGKGLYADINVTYLLDAQVSSKGLEKAFQSLARNVQPDDVFVFFIAGHGKTVDGQYYFIPQDFRYKGAKSIETGGIGQTKWQSWFATIPARKSLLIYDTCESGSLTGQRIATRGLERVAALDKLTRAMGRTVLSAATDDAPALEGFRGHGVFTYALLQALARSDDNSNKLIEVTELAAFVDARVPEISAEAFGLRQVPQMNITGSNFPLVRQTAKAAPAGTTGKAISKKPTHMVIKQSDLFKEAGGVKPVARKLKPGTMITLVRTEKGWALVARDGKALGYVPTGNLLAAQ